MMNIWKELNSIDEEYLTEDSTLYKGIFWVVDQENIDNNKNYCFLIPTNTSGDVLDINDIGIANSGNTYNHKAVWNRLSSKLTNNKPYNYYPRGRVEINNGVAKIFLNGNINYQEVIDFIAGEFNLTAHNGIKKITVIEDNSSHYLCYLDDGWVSAK